MKNLRCHPPTVASLALLCVAMEALSATACSSSNPGAANGGAPGSSGSSATSGGATATGGATSTMGGATMGGAATTGGVATTTGGVGTTGGAATTTGGVGTTGGVATTTGGVGTTGGAATTTGGASATGGSGTAGSAGSVSCPTMNEEKFSFFMVSQKALIKLSGNADGFGGDLGGITGADSICQRVAEGVSPCQKNKVWHAFLSTTKENAIDRIGTGPWYDRTGRLFGNNIADIARERPAGDSFFLMDVSTEDGTPSKNPDGTGNVDNHQTLTGSGTDGKLYTQSATAGQGSTACGGEEWTPEKATCWDWTSKEPAGCPRVGHSWPRQGSGIHWISVWNEGGCAPGGTTTESFPSGDVPRVVGAFGGYGGFYCFAVTPRP